MTNSRPTRRCHHLLIEMKANKILFCLRNEPDYQYSSSGNPSPSHTSSGHGGASAGPFLDPNVSGRRMDAVSGSQPARRGSSPRVIEERTLTTTRTVKTTSRQSNKKKGKKQRVRREREERSVGRRRS